MPKTNITILQETPGCTYKTCKKSNPSKQHNDRRHRDAPYFRKVGEKLVKFARSGTILDEERPFICLCGKKYQNTRSLADHLSAGCEIFKNYIEKMGVELTHSTDFSTAVPISSTTSNMLSVSREDYNNLKTQIEEMSKRMDDMEQYIQLQYETNINRDFYNSNTSNYLRDDHEQISYFKSSRHGGYIHDNSYNSYFKDNYYQN